MKETNVEMHKSQYDVLIGTGLFLLGTSGAWTPVGFPISFVFHLNLGHVLAVLLCFLRLDVGIRQHTF